MCEVQAYAWRTSWKASLSSQNSFPVTIVVVVGYGVQKKENLTGSVAAVNFKDVRHKDNEVITFSIEGFAKAYSSGGDNIDSNDIFDLLNQYLAWLDSIESTKNNSEEIYDNLKLMLNILLTATDDVNSLIQRYTL